MAIYYDFPDLHADSVVWSTAESNVVSARGKVNAIVNSKPTLPSAFKDIQTRYDTSCSTAQTYFQGGVGRCAAVAANLLANAGEHRTNDEQASTNVGNAGNRGNGNGSGHGGDHGGNGEKYKDKLEGHWEPGGPGHDGEPGNPNDPKDDKVYDKLETMVNGLLEHDGVRLNAMATDDPFDQSQETVVAYTDADGKVHVISTNPNQGTHAQSMTISFLDEQGNMHVVTSVDGKMVEDTTTPNGTAMERRVVQQGTLDQMMSEAKEVSISYTDDKGAEHVVSTDKDQGGQMNQVVLAYADENGQQHMISNEKGIDAPTQDSIANQHLAFGAVADGGKEQLSVATLGQVPTSPGGANR